MKEKVRNRTRINLRNFLILIMVASGGIASAAGHGGFSSDLLAELAEARTATAKYHDIDQAEADGYVSLDFCEPHEGCHWVKFSLLDCSFDVTQPEILVYSPDLAGPRLHLVSVEYVQPRSCSPTQPEGFTGSDDVWREDEEGFDLWEVSAWIWLRNPDGMFAQHNPRVP